MRKKTSIQINLPRNSNKALTKGTKECVKWNMYRNARCKGQWKEEPNVNKNKKAIQRIKLSFGI